MSSLSRRTATAGLLALVLLTVPSAALAAGPDALPSQADGGQGRAAEARPADSAGSRQAPDVVPSATPSARGERPAAGAAGGAAAGRSAVRPEGRPEGRAAGRPAVRPAESRRATARPERARTAKLKPAAGTNAGKGGADAPARTADPRGNNGTFKVDGPVLDTSRGNEPHVSCAFRLNFFGYDAGQLAAISVTAIAPTPGATTRVDGLQLISTGSAKGGEYDGSFPAAGTWDAGDLGLDPTQPQHLKVSVEAVNADGSDVPGGAKSKVFWLEPCAASAEPAAEPAVEAAVEPVAVSGTAVTPVFGPRAVAASPAAPAEPAAAVLAGSVSAQATAPAAVVAAPVSLVQPFVLPPVSARASAPPAQLPFTGSPQVLILLLGGLVALAGGAALLVAVRRTA